MNDKPETRTKPADEEPGATPNKAQDSETWLGGDKARAGETSGHMRVLLAVSTVLAAAALLGIWWHYFG